MNVVQQVVNSWCDLTTDIVNQSVLNLNLSESIRY